MPYILLGVRLIGVNSDNEPEPRDHVWRRNIWCRSVVPLKWFDPRQNKALPGRNSAIYGTEGST
jgi:hypothetical protein